MELLGSILLSLLGVLGILTSVIFLFYWYERLNTPVAELNQPTYKLFTIIQLWLKFFTTECTRPVVFLLWFLRQRKKPNPFMAEKALSRPPVILVHGIYDKPATWTFMISALEKAGFRVITYGYTSFSHTIDTPIADFTDFMYLTEASFPDQKFLFVGHSLGGLVLRKWLSIAGNEQRAHGLVTLATPHKGSRLAVFHIGKVAPCLVPGSSFLKELEASAPLPFPCLAIASGSDEMVLPGDSLLPPEGWKLSVIDNIGHLELIHRSRGIQHIVREISTVFPSKPETSPTPEEQAV